MKKRIFLFIVWLLCNSYMAIAQYQIEVKDASSLVRVGMDPHPIDSTDTALANTLMNALQGGSIDSVIYVRDAWERKAKMNTTKDKAYSSLAFLLSGYLDRLRHVEKRGLDLLSKDLLTYFLEDEAKRLKDYLTLKYELNNYRPRSVKEYIQQRTFYDDMLMFNDPNRKEWDHTDEIMASIPLRAGDKIVDVGCGFGFNSVRFHQIVGEKGVVYSTDTEKAYVDYFTNLLQRNHIEGITPILSASNNLSVNDTVDVVFMSSLYHIIYTWSREDERSAFLQSIKNSLRPGGYIVIVDNINLHGGELNNCHVTPSVVEAQLGYWGFRQIRCTQLSNQRYMSVFCNEGSYQPKRSVKKREKETFPVLNITGQKSLVHIGSLDSYDITDRGIDAARYVYNFMGGGSPSLAEIAIKKYEELIPSENFGGEYSALQWLCEVKLAEKDKRDQLLRDPLDDSFYHKMTDDSCKVIRYYLLHKYKLGSDSLRMQSDSLLEMSGEVGRTHRSYLEDYILAMNPRRPLWEHTEKIMEHLGLKEGETIADIGSGSGFFTYRFSPIVGDAGKVFSVEIKDEHIKTLKDFIAKTGFHNVEVIKGREDLLELPTPVDKMFMCSLYHVLYGVIADDVRDTYLRSLVSLLKPKGELIVVDNGPVDDDTLPYHGPYISPQLIAMQLSFYGLELVDTQQIIPQRYMLTFKKKD